jgi:hypothetical protein
MSATDQASLYVPLHPWQTRLLKLLPGDSQDPLRCELHVAAIIIDEGLGVEAQAEAVEYEALSYSWGRPERTALVDCNGMDLLIPPTAAEGLRQLRKESNPRWLWCDAICINQNDITEKAAQVKQMLRIFIKARTVVAWLGREIVGTLKLAEHLRGLEDKHKLEIARMAANMHDPEMDETISELLSRPWFARTWVSSKAFHQIKRNIPSTCGHSSKLDLQISLGPRSSYKRCRLSQFGAPCHL